MSQLPELSKNEVIEALRDSRLPRYSKARVTEALLKNGHKLTAKQKLAIEVYYFKELTPEVLAELHETFDDRVITHVLHRGLEALELSVPPFKLSQTCERARWALETTSDVVTLNRSDLVNLLLALGEL